MANCALASGFLSSHWETKRWSIPGNQVVKIAELNGKFLEKLERNLKVIGGNNFH
jgi:hypothetical protein